MKEFALPVNYDQLRIWERKAVREQYVRQQEGNCHHCGSPLDGSPSESVQDAAIDHSLFPPSFFNWPVHLHHCHKTKMTIGAVHNRCNAFLWQYQGE